MISPSYNGLTANRRNYRENFFRISSNYDATNIGGFGTPQNLHYHWKAGDVGKRLAR